MYHVSVNVFENFKCDSIQKWLRADLLPGPVVLLLRIQFLVNVYNSNRKLLQHQKLLWSSLHVYVPLIQMSLCIWCCIQIFLLVFVNFIWIYLRRGGHHLNIFNAQSNKKVFNRVLYWVFNKTVQSHFTYNYVKVKIVHYFFGLHLLQLLIEEICLDALNEY